MKFTIKKKLDNWNKIIGYARANRYLANKKKQDEMDEIKEFLPKEKITKYPIKMIFKWHIKRNVSDLDNKSTKSILDCMQKEGILQNDNIKYINEIHHIAIPDKEDYVDVEIEEELK